MKEEWCFGFSVTNHSTSTSTSTVSCISLDTNQTHSISFSLMASLNFSLFFICSSFLLLIILEPVTVESKHKGKAIDGPLTNLTKQFSFSDFHPIKNPTILNDVKLLGSARFSVNTSSIQIPDTTLSFDLRHQAGRAIYSSPIRLFDPLTETPASFKTTFSFQFKNTSSSSSLNESESGGSGLTFIIVPDELTVGRPGPWLAMMNDACEDDYKVIAVEFDTRKNPTFGDPNDNHVGINLGSIVSNVIINASDVGVSLKDGSVHRASINYNGLQRWIEIRLGSETSLKSIFSASLDLSPFLNEYMFVGFSASTGTLTEIHNVLSWNFSSISQAHLRMPSSETCERKVLAEFNKTAHQKPPSSFLIFVAVVVLCLVVLLNLYCNGKNRGNEKSTVTILPEKNKRPRPPHKPRRFSLSEISSATRGFSEGQILSCDSTRGICYRGTLFNGCQVMVTRFSTRFLNSPGLDRRRVMKEIGSVSRVRHPNLVSIRGWCVDNKETILVYDYLPNGSLDRWLFGLGVLPWTRRFKVVRDLAESLSFLHSKKLVHRNVKTSSVFLDITFRAVLGDFGFGLAPTDPIRVETVLAQNADVFAFGIVALEIVAGRRSFDLEPGSGEEPMGLLDFAWKMREKDELRKVVDRRMGPIFNLEQAIRVLEVGLLCTVNDASNSTLTMEEVVGYLSMEIPIPKLPLRRPVMLFPYNSATNLCTGYTCTPFR